VGERRYTFPPIATQPWLADALRIVGIGRCEEAVVALFNRKSKEVVLAPCPQCGQPLRRDALECEQCGVDLRETYVRPVLPRDDASARTEPER
jgi:hypothetical protein